MDYLTRFKRLSGRRYRVTRPVGLVIGGGSGLVQMAVPVGFEFDVSVPRLLWWLFDPHDDRFLEAAALHDFALHELNWAREVAAAPFGHSLRQNGVSRIKRLAMVLAVIVWKWN